MSAVWEFAVSSCLVLLGTTDLVPVNRNPVIKPVVLNRRFVEQWCFVSKFSALRECFSILRNAKSNQHRKLVNIEEKLKVAISHIRLNIENLCKRDLKYPIKELLQFPTFFIFNFSIYDRWFLL